MVMEETRHRKQVVSGLGNVGYVIQNDFIVINV